MGCHHDRRQIVQAAELGRHQGEDGAMTGPRAKQRMASVGSLLLLIGLGCERASPPQATGELPTVTTHGGVEMVLIPAGSFEMGSRRGKEDEAFVHRIEVDA